MNSKQTAAGKTAQGTYKVRCDVFDLRRINSMQLALGSVFVGWHYANPSETEVLITYRQPQNGSTMKGGKQ